MLRGLHEAGFDRVVATPHMRPGMFDNDRPALARAFEAMQPVLTGRGGQLPAVHLASEHFFDDVVFGRLVRGEALPYPGGKACWSSSARARSPRACSTASSTYARGPGPRPRPPRALRARLEGRRLPRPPARRRRAPAARRLRARRQVRPRPAAGRREAPRGRRLRGRLLRRAQAARRRGGGARHRAPRAAGRRRRGDAPAFRGTAGHPGPGQVSWHA